MIVYIKAINITTMECVKRGYNLSIKFDRDGNIILKSVNEYSNVEIQESGSSSKMLNVIVNGVDIKQHDLISTHMTTKEAWDIMRY